jgi:hypothetical protein
MVYSKQLINAIYEFLYEVCSNPEAPGRKVSDRRDMYLEDKTAELFQEFLLLRIKGFRVAMTSDSLPFDNY